MCRTIKILEVNKILSDAGMDPIAGQDKKRNHEYLIPIWNEGNDTAIDKIVLLLSLHVFTDMDVFNFFYSQIDFIDTDFEKCPLFNILSRANRDGTLIVSDPELIYELCLDYRLDFIKGIVRVGGEIDPNSWLVNVFSGYKLEYETFNYLMDNFSFNQDAINETAGWLILNDDIYEDEAQQAFNRLSQAGISINSYYKYSFEHSSYHSFLALVFCHDAKLFSKYLKQSPSKEIIENFPWEFIISECDIDDEKFENIKLMQRLGYSLPLVAISECLEDYSYIEYSKGIRKLID